MNLWLTLFAIWLVANASLALDVVASGVVISSILAIAFSSFSSAYAEIKLTPKALLNYFLYLGVFLWELLLANMNVARIVMSPKISIQPGIVKVHTRLKSRTGRLVLANSITLTPGTLVVDIDDDTLYVHWIDVTTQDSKKATQEIAAKFEKYLEEIYG
ncbi:MAG: Na+/H+ antiporter subunit E [Gammaproteobacteria bacterium]|nr:Na+/H+ antiporter subunit E [Gammaproteobacteria bacterium]